MSKLRSGLWALAVCGLPSAALAQNSSLFQGQPMARQAVSANMSQASWTYVTPAPPAQVEVNDIVVVRVNELSAMQSDGEMDRRKNAIYDALLKDWVFLDGFEAIRPAPQSDGDARVRGQLQQLYRAEAEMQTRESLTLNIACHVTDIRPNGSLVLEGHKQVTVNEEVWDVALSGVCRREDVGPDGVVVSSNVDELKVDKRERGHVNDSYRRGWLLRWLDEFHVF